MEYRSSNPKIRVTEASHMFASCFEILLWIKSSLPSDNSSSDYVENVLHRLNWYKPNIGTNTMNYYNLLYIYVYWLARDFDYAELKNIK